jgi:hypothetical protein
MTELIQGLAIPFIGTSAGAACVFLMKNQLNVKIEKILTGFAAGGDGGSIDLEPSDSGDAAEQRAREVVFRSGSGRLYARNTVSHGAG